MAEAPVGIDMTIVFDGGALGNPGHGYGTYRLADREGHVEVVPLEFGDRVTNNQAEYRTFIAALERALAHARARGWNPATLTIVVRSDSDLLVKQVLGHWKVKHPDLRPLRDRARQLMAEFGGVDLAWWSRQHSVRVLGH